MPSALTLGPQTLQWIDAAATKTFESRDKTKVPKCPDTGFRTPATIWRARKSSGRFITNDEVAVGAGRPAGRAIRRTIKTIPTLLLDVRSAAAAEMTTAAAAPKDDAISFYTSYFHVRRAV